MDPFSLKDQCLLLCSTSIHPLILPRHGQALEPLHPSQTCSILPSASAQMGQEGLRLASSEASHCFQHLFLLKIVSNCCPYFLMPTLILPSPIKYYLSPLGTLLLPKILWLPSHVIPCSSAAAITLGCRHGQPPPPSPHALSRPALFLLLLLSCPSPSPTLLCSVFTVAAPSPLHALSSLDAASPSERSPWPPLSHLSQRPWKLPLSPFPNVLSGMNIWAISSWSSPPTW